MEEEGNPGRQLEWNLSGKHLAAAAVGLVALCAAFFFLGRWMERAEWQADLRADSFEEFSADPEGRGEDLPPEAVGVGRELTFYEDLAQKAPPADLPPEGPEGGFTIQVFATHDAGAAEALAGKLRERGYPGSVEPGRDETGRQFFRVRVGPYPERNQAEKVASRLEREENLSTWIRAPE